MCKYLSKRIKSVKKFKTDKKDVRGQQDLKI